MNRRQLAGNLRRDFNPFQENYLAEIMAAVVGAWTRMKEPCASELEDRITRRIAGRLAHDSNFEEIPYEVTTQHTLLGLDGQILGRLDLRFKHRNSQRVYFAFESKRLHVTHPGGHYSPGYSTYTGSDGMMAFVDGQYSSGLPAGGMLSYVMDGRSSEARIGLEKRVEKQRKPLILRASATFAQSTLSGAVLVKAPGAYLAETEHDLKTHHLRLFHLLLPVRGARRTA